MSTVPAIKTVVAPPMPVIPKNLPYEDKECMESAWHRDQMNFLIGILQYQWRDRKDFYCGGNMFIYFSEQHYRNQDFRGPDFFVVLDVDRDRERLYWAAWEEEGKLPDVIIEIMSATTRNEDLTNKKEIYRQTFRTSEYFCYDPEDQSLIGWRLINRRYVLIPSENGRMYSETLEMWLGNWVGAYLEHHATWLCFFNDAGEVLLDKGEAEARRADTEAQRANAAEAESARLRQELEQLRNQQLKNGK